MAGEGEHEEQVGKGHHLALVLFPSQGHVNPMIKLAHLLHSKGFSITFIHRHLNSLNPSNHPNFKFEEIIPHAFSDPLVSKSNPIEFLSATITSFEVPLRDCLLRLKRENPLNPVSCLITDAHMYSTEVVAEELGLPRIVFTATSHLSSLVFAVYSRLVEKGLLSIQDHQSELSVAELPPLRVKDLPILLNIELNAQCQFYDKFVNKTRSATAMIINSSHHMAQDILPDLQREYPIPIFLVGPLCKASSSFSNTTSLGEQEQSCLDWLDKQVTGSVLYVSFGTVAKMEEAQLVEIAWGLANSEQPFLWVVRPGSVIGSEGEWTHLPEGFVEKTRGKGWIVKWAPQQEVLAHPAVGGFWTHSGWNSTLESVCSGVPMICWPQFGDQTINARLVSCGWRVGLQLGSGRLERGEIEASVKRLMVDKEGEEMRRRIRVLENAEMSVTKGGSSYQSIDKLVNLILSA